MHGASPQVLQQLEEEELMEECLEAMLEEERQHERNINSTAWSTATGTSDNNTAELCQQLSGLKMQDDLAKQVLTTSSLFPGPSKKKKKTVFYISTIYNLPLSSS